MDEEKKSKIDKKIIIGVVVGILIGLIIGALIMYFINPSKSIAKVDGKSITEKQIYDKLEKYYSSDVLTMVLEEVDDIILSKKYKEDDRMKEEIEAEANKYIESYIEYYGGTEEEFLKECGFEDYDDFKKYLALEYRRNLYYYDYLEEVIGKEKIKEYYEENNFGEIGTKHILVQISDDMSEEDALNLAKEIITKIDEGIDFDEVANQYVEQNVEIVITEDLGYINFGDTIDEAFMEALKTMEDNTYSKEPVKSSFGYHIIYKMDTREFSLEDARNDVINALYNDVDAKTQMEKLIELREEEGLKIINNKFEEEYKEIKNAYIEE